RQDRAAERHADHRHRRDARRDDVPQRSGSVDAAGSRQCRESRQAAGRGLRPAEERRDARAGADRDERHRRAAGHGLSRHEQGPGGRPRRDVQRAVQRRADPDGVPRHDGGGRLRAADRVRQRGQPADLALGATRSRVVRQLLVESVILGCMGGITGLLFAMVGVRLFDNAVAGSGKPYWIIFSMDFTVFAFLAGICVLTGVLFGLAPALQVSRTNVNEILKEGGRSNSAGTRARWMTGTMVVLEIALTLVLLVGAGLMVRSFLKLYTLDMGFNGDHLMAMRLELPSTKYPDAAARRAFYDRLAPRLASLPGAESLSFTTSVPPSGVWRRGVEVDGRPARRPE